MLGSVDALSTLRGDGQKDSVLEGLHLLQATSAEPNAVKFKLIGTELNIDAGMFDIPVSVYPICKGDQFLAYPLVGSEHQRWWVYSLLYPIFDKTFIEDSYACRRGKGQKAAADRLQDMLKQAEILGGKWYHYFCCWYQVPGRFNGNAD